MSYRVSKTIRIFSAREQIFQNMEQGPFLENPGNFSGPYSHSKISNLELFYSHILKMKLREVPFMQEFSSAYTSPFLDTDDLKMA